MKLGIIGGGASGMMAALSALEHTDAQIILFERQSRLGRKLLATGNGRCNLSNQNADVSHYHGADPEFVGEALQTLDVEETLRFFAHIGLLTVTEADGKIYPFSDQANSVVDVLRLALEQSSVQLQLGCEVTNIFPEREGFTLTTSDGEFFVDKLIVSAGSLAGGKLGGTKAGYQLLRSLGHRCTKLYPSLVQIQTDPTHVRALKGVRADAKVTLLSGDHVLATECGEVQFTDFGISGPCVFALSRAAAMAGHGITARLDLCRQMRQPELAAMLADKQRSFPGLTLENLLTGLLHNRLGRTILRSLELNLNDSVAKLSYRTLSNIAAAIKQFDLPVLGCMPLEQAQVAAGGIETSAFCPRTMESRLVRDLYATGEVLDIDGDCGGYNLQWAWSSGYLAGQLRHEEESL